MEEYKDDYWLHLYVALSRVRTMDQMFLFGELRRPIFERGPPAWLKKALGVFDSKAVEHLNVVDKALHKLGWDPREEGEVDALHAFVS